MKVSGLFHSRAFLWAIFLVSSVSLTACLGGSSSSSSGLSGDSAATISSLSDLPDTASMVSTSDSTTSLYRAAVSGTPPTLSQVSENSEDIDYLDDLFWGGLIAEIRGEDPETGSLSADQCNGFWGGTEGNGGGFAACHLLMATGRAIEPVATAGVSLCYMKNMPTAASGVTVSPAGTDADSIFEQGAANKVVKVEVSGQQDDECQDCGGEQDIFIRVYGTNTEGVDSNTYKVDLWFCSENGDLRGVEQITANQSTGAFTSTNSSSEQWGDFSLSVSASLTEDADGNVIFDTSKVRTAELAHSGSFEEEEFNFGVDISISGENVISQKMYDVFSRNNETNVRKAYMLSSYSGASAGALRFREAAYKEVNESNDGVNAHNFRTAVEYQDGTYTVVGEENALYNDLDNVSIQSDSFFDSEPSPDLSVINSGDYSCDAEVDVTVSMDFSDPAVEAIGQSCESNRLDFEEFCWKQEIFEAEANMWGLCSFDDGPDDF